MSTPYGGNDPQQWGQQGGFGQGQPQQGQPQQPQPGQWGQQPQQPPGQWGQQPAGYPGGPQQGGYPAQGQPDQWAQQGGYPQSGPLPQQDQWAQPPAYGQYPMYPQEPEKKKSRAALWIGLVVLVLLLGTVAILGWVAPGFFTTKVFDAGSVEQGVEKVLGDKGMKVDSVTCPEGEEVEKGNTFVCDVKIGGQDKEVEIEVVDVEKDPPEYQVNDPK